MRSILSYIAAGLFAIAGAISLYDPSVIRDAQNKFSTTSYEARQIIDFYANLIIEAYPKTSLLEDFREARQATKEFHRELPTARRTLEEEGFVIPSLPLEEQLGRIFGTD